VPALSLPKGPLYSLLPLPVPLFVIPFVCHSRRESASSFVVAPLFVIPQRSGGICICTCPCPTGLEGAFRPLFRPPPKSASAAGRHHQSEPRLSAISCRAPTSRQEADTSHRGLSSRPRAGCPIARPEPAEGFDAALSRRPWGYRPQIPAGFPTLSNPKSSGAPSFAPLRRVGCKPLGVPPPPPTPPKIISQKTSAKSHVNPTNHLTP
jgi:hypothetical protein